MIPYICLYKHDDDINFYISVSPNKNDKASKSVRTCYGRMAKKKACKMYTFYTNK